MRVRQATAVLAVVACAIAAAARAAAEEPVDRFPGLATAYAVRIDDAVRWARNLDQSRPPASLAKLATALALLEDPRWQADAAVQVSAAAAAIEGSRAGLAAGDTVRARDLLTAMLVRSGNDACAALVEHAAGSLAAFRPRLAAVAERLGLTATRILHPCGLDLPGQQTTVRDLLRLADAALAQPDIRLRAAAQDATISTLAGRRLRFRNSNALIGRNPEAIGLKSGYTRAAGRCLIAVAERNGHRVVVVLLDAGERWWDASGLLAQGLGVATGRPPP